MDATPEFRPQSHATGSDAFADFRVRTKRLLAPFREFIARDASKSTDSFTEFRHLESENAADKFTDFRTHVEHASDEFSEFRAATH